MDTSENNTPTIIYAIYFVALFTGIPFLIGVIIAYVSKDKASPAARSHYEHQIDIFWRVFVGVIVLWIITMVSVVLMVVFIGYIGLVLVALAALYLWVWTLIRCIRGVQASSNGAPYSGPQGWAP